MRSRLALLAAASLLTLDPAGAAAQTAIGGQVRPRFENRTGTDAFVSMRTRAHVAHALDWGSAFVQIQDVRLWGEELSTVDPDANALDVHQAWLTVGGDDLWLRAGRQEVSFGNERLVGALDWVQQARAFDGVRLAVPLAGLRFDFIGMQLAEQAAATAPDDRQFAGGYATWGAEPLLVEGFALADGEDAWRWTAGGRALASLSVLEWHGEAALQRGEVGAADVSAWMASASLGTDMGPVGVTLWYDHLSGDDEPLDGTTEVFNTLFATNHKFYGYADVFTDIPLHTGGRGLRDLALILDGTFRRAALVLALHRFDAAADDGLPSSRFGEEVDLTVGYPLGEGLRLGAGASWVNVGPALEAVRGFDEDRWFGYLMLDARF